MQFQHPNLLLIIFFAAAYTPKRTGHHHYAEHAPGTPVSCEGLAKRTRITIQATPPSVHIQQLLSLDVNIQNSSDDDEMPEFLPRRLFPNAEVQSTPIYGASSNDIFGPTPLPLPSFLEPQPLPIPNFDNHIPAQIVSHARYSTRAHHGTRGRAVHPLNSHLLWCTKAGHWVPSHVFGLQMQCAHCREMHNAAAQCQRAEAAAAQSLADLNMNLPLNPSPAPNAHQNPAPASQPGMQPQPDSPPNNLPNHDPLTDLAVSAEEKALLATAWQKIMDIKMEQCNQCHEKWFDLNIQNGGCAKCRKNDKYKPSNKMFPGLPPPDLPKLSQMEEMLISPVHALVQLWQVRGGHFKYTGHICNFPRETSVLHHKLPLLPEHYDIIIMRHAGVEQQTDLAVYEDFRVHRQNIEAWLCYLEVSHPTFRNRTVTVAYNLLNQLLLNSTVHHRL